MNKLKTMEEAEKQKDFFKPNIRSKKMDYRKYMFISGYSDCCIAPVYNESGICSKCGEHCELINDEQELDYFSDDETTENNNLILTNG